MEVACEDRSLGFILEGSAVAKGTGMLHREGLRLGQGVVTMPICCGITLFSYQRVDLVQFFMEVLPVRDGKSFLILLSLRSSFSEPDLFASVVNPDMLAFSFSSLFGQYHSFHFMRRDICLHVPSSELRLQLLQIGNS